MNRFSRADFLAVLANTAPVLKSLNKISYGGLDTYKGNWGDPQLLHLIRRTLFGVSQKDYNFFSGKNLQQCLDVLLTQSPEPPPPVNDYNDETFTDPEVPFGKTWVYASFGDPEGPQDDKRVTNLKEWWVNLMMHQDHSLTEKMTLFWSNHLAAQMFLMKDARLDYGYVALLRSHSLGNFKKLVREVTTNPGMLEYLNGNVNTAAAPNENYARELQELFTVGKGADSHYTESDVKEAARVLTGWQDDDKPEGGGILPVFNAALHDEGNKQFSAFYEHTVIKGKKGQEGKTETDELIDMIFKQRETAKYVCRNLYRWFIYYDIDKTIEGDIIEPLADVFIKNNFEIKPVLQTLLSSEHFFHASNIGCLIKNPTDHLIGACRQFGITFSPDDSAKERYALNIIAWHLVRMGMEPGDPPNVAGWPATYQFPSFNQMWINSTTLTIRNATTDALLSHLGLANSDISVRLNLLAFTAQLPDAENVNRLIEESTKLLCPMPFDKAEINYMKTILLSGQTSDHYWIDAWKEYLAKPIDEMSMNIVYTRLSAYYTYILQRSEYQLC